jgi:hypothetical protein
MKKKINIRHFKVAPIIGFGCWRDDYSNTFPEGGYCWNIILFCFRIQIGEIYYIDPNAKVIEDYEIDFGGILKIK